MDKWIFPVDKKLKDRKKRDHLAGVIVFNLLVLAIFFLTVANMDGWEVEGEDGNLTNSTTSDSLTNETQHSTKMQMQIINLENQIIHKNILLLGNFNNFHKKISHFEVMHQITNFLSLSGNVRCKFLSYQGPVEFFEDYQYFPGNKSDSDSSIPIFIDHVIIRFDESWFEFHQQVDFYGYSTNSSSNLMCNFPKSESEKMPTNNNKIKIKSTTTTSFYQKIDQFITTLNITIQENYRNFEQKLEITFILEKSQNLLDAHLAFYCQYCVFRCFQIENF